MASKKSKKEPQETPPAEANEPEASEDTNFEGEADERDEVYSTRWYWTAFILSLGSLILALLYFDRTLPSFFLYGFYFVIPVAALLVLTTFVGLVRRYRLIHGVRSHSVDIARRSGIALSQLKRPPAGEETEKRTRKKPNFAGLGKAGRRVVLAVSAVFKFVYRLIVRTVYLVEFIVVWTIVLSYDLIYGVLYAAWWLAYHALRIAWKIVYFALRVIWKILRIFTKLPVLRGIWAEQMRPPILAKWNGLVDKRREKWNKSVDRRKRVVAAKGGDPELWHQERIARHWFPLPLPHAAKDALKERLDHAAKNKDERVARGHPFKTAEERAKTNEEKAKASEEREKAKAEAAAARERAKAEKQRAKRDEKKAKKEEKAVAKAEKKDSKDPSAEEKESEKDKDVGPKDAETAAE